MTAKLTFKANDELNKKLRKLSELTSLSIAYIINEVLTVSFRNGVAKDMFWFYLKDHSDPFLSKEIIKGIDNSLLLKESFSTIEAVFCGQEKRIKDLEQNQRKIVTGIVMGNLNKRTQLTDFIGEVVKGER